MANRWIETPLDSDPFASETWVAPTGRVATPAPVSSWQETPLDIDPFADEAPAVEPPTNIFGEIGNSLGRGWNRMQQGANVAAAELGIYSPEEAAAAIAANERDIKQFPKSADLIESERKWQEAEGFVDSFMTLLTNPGIATNTVFESLPLSIPSAVGGVAGMAAGPAGAATGVGLGSGLTEYTVSILDYMAEKGVDTSDEGQIRAALQNPELLSGAREHAAKRGVPIGLFDALTAGLAGKVAGPTLRRTLGAGGIEMAGGASGEAAAQITSEGEITSGKDIALEAVGEIGGLVTDTAPVAIARGRKAIIRDEGAPDDGEEVTVAPDQTGVPPGAVRVITPDGQQKAVGERVLEPVAEAPRPADAIDPAGPPLTPGDIASPLPNREIQAGKKIIEDALAGRLETPEVPSDWEPLSDEQDNPVGWLNRKTGKIRRTEEGDPRVQSGQPVSAPVEPVGTVEPSAPAGPAPAPGAAGPAGAVDAATDQAPQVGSKVAVERPDGTTKTGTVTGTTEDGRITVSGDMGGRLVAAPEQVKPADQPAPSLEVEKTESLTPTFDKKGRALMAAKEQQRTVGGTWEPAKAPGGGWTIRQVSEAAAPAPKPEETVAAVEPAAPEQAEPAPTQPEPKRNPVEEYWSARSFKGQRIEAGNPTPAYVEWARNAVEADLTRDIEQNGSGIATSAARAELKRREEAKRQAIRDRDERDTAAAKNFRRGDEVEFTSVGPFTTGEQSRIDRGVIKSGPDYAGPGTFQVSLERGGTVTIGASQLRKVGDSKPDSKLETPAKGSKIEAAKARGRQAAADGKTIGDLQREMRSEGASNTEVNAATKAHAAADEAAIDEKIAARKARQERNGTATELPIEDDRERQRRENVRKLEEIEAEKAAEQPPAAEQPAGYGSGNKVFTADAAERARAVLRDKLRNQINSGIDPEILQAGVTLAGYHIEAGARSFAAYSRAMIDDLGEAVRPYLRSWYEGVRYYPGFDAAGMTPAAEIGAEEQVNERAGSEQPREVGEARVPEAGAGVAEGEPAGDGTSGDVEAPPAEDAGAAPPARGRRGSGARSRRPRGEDGNRPDAAGDAVAGRDGAGGEGMAPDGAGGRDRAEPKAVRPDYFVSDPESLIGGTPKVRFARNKRAIEAFKAITDEGRDPTPEELDAMAAYIGWGSFGQELFQGSFDRPRPKDGWQTESEWLRKHLGKEEWESAQNSIINAHYTDPPTVMAMWDMVRAMGFKGGRVLEPSMGIGNFFSLMPRDLHGKSDLTGIELDKLTGGMAKLLHPGANISIKGYQDSQTPDDFYDLVIGNWPFSEIGPADRRYAKLSPTLHDFFFLKALDQTRPGGLVVGITSAGTMDKASAAVRGELARKADLVAAYRLPSGAFEKYAGTAVVTDIIILQKREEPRASLEDVNWLQATNQVVTSEFGGYQEIRVNEFYWANKDNVLGTLAYGSGTTYGRPAMIVKRPADIFDRLNDLRNRVPTGIYEPRKPKKTIRYETNNTTDRQGSVTEKDGEFFVVQGERLAALNDVAKYRLKDAAKTKSREDQIRALIDMRRTAGALIDAERDGDDKADTLRPKLKKAYDAFRKKHGPITESDGYEVLRKVRDPFAPLLNALERPDGSPAAILTRPTVRARRRVENPSIRDAFVLARNESPILNLERIAELSGRPVDEVERDLVASKAIYRTPGGGFEVADVFLSGNVRRKLREALAAKELGEDMDGSIEALREAVPKDVPYFQIEAKLGASWVENDHYADFIGELLGVQGAGNKAIDLRFTAGSWRLRLGALNGRAEARAGWGTSEYRFDKLVQAAMNNQTVKITKKDADGNTYTDTEAMKEVADKIAKIRDEFSSWIWRDAERRVASERNYNEIMNAIATPRFDGSFLEFPGMALSRGEDPFSLRQHQVNAIWRGVANGRGLFAHEVGTGKTYTMGGIAVESRRYGLARKPMIIAHNANSATVAREIMEMYPGAQVLYVDNLSPDTIDATLQRIATDEWDAVVIPHSLVSRMTLTEATLMEMAREDIEALEAEAIEAAKEDDVTLEPEDMDDEDAMKKVRSTTAKNLVKQRNRIIETIKKQAIRASKDGAVTFESLGIDAIIVDEAHEFKKPPIATKMKMRGLNTQASAQSIQLKFLTDFVKKQRGGKGVFTFTGTPITNTLTEIFNQMRYVMDDEMARATVKDWDHWFNTFADSTNDVELTDTGEYEPVTRLAAFVNVAELRRMAGQYMDIVFASDMPEFKPRSTSTGKTMADTLTDAERAELVNGRTEKPIGRPYKKVIPDVAPMGPAQEMALQELVKRAARFKNASGKDRRDMLMQGAPEVPIRVGTDAANAGLDVRLFDPDAADEPQSKVNRASKNILAHFKEHPLATQAVFVERGFNDESVVTTGRTADGKPIRSKVKKFALVADLVDKLVAGGIPREQIAVVDGGVSKEKRKEIADKMNRAEIRVVIGNTKTLGVGVNMQANLRAMHHLDAPWMPGDLEQRNGRGERQGNKWNTVLEYRYITEKLDGRRWQVLMVKDRFIKAFLKADENVRVIEGDAVDDSEDSSGDSLADTLSQAAGDPRLLLLNKFKADVEKLEGRERQHTFGIADARRRVRMLQEQNGDLRVQAETAQAEAAHWETVKDQEFTATVGKETYTTRTEAQDAIDRRLKELPKVGRMGPWELVANVRGYRLFARYEFDLGNGFPVIEAKMSRAGGKEVEIGAPSVASVEGTARRFGADAVNRRERIAENEASIERLSKMAEVPFAQQATLEAKRKMLADVERDLQQNPVPAPSWLRAGAPTDTEIFVNGEPRVVEGHKWTDDGYFLVTEQGLVRYLDAKTADGQPVFEEREFTAPPKVEEKKPEQSNRRAQAGRLSRQTETAAFKRWFGDSKVVDADGKPLVVYHGTGAKDFDSFEITSDIGFHFGRVQAADARILQTMNPLRGARVVPAYLSIQNPLRTADLGDWDPGDVVSELRRLGIITKAQEQEVGIVDREWVRDALAAKGYDGIVYSNRMEDSGNDSWIALDPTQIKSATGNAGTFDPRDPSITAQATRLEPRLIPETAAEVRSIVADAYRSVAGADARLSLPDRIESEPMAAELSGNPDAQEFYGDYLLDDDVARVAMQPYGGTQDTRDLVETAYHEAFHRLQVRFLRPKEIAALKAAQAELRAFLARAVDRAAADRIVGELEVEAYAFQAYAAWRDGSREIPGMTVANSGIPERVRLAWDFLRNMVRRVRNALAGRGFQTWEDIFERARSGEIANREPAFNEAQAARGSSMGQAMRPTRRQRQEATGDLFNTEFGAPRRGVGEMLTERNRTLLQRLRGAVSRDAIRESVDEWRFWFQDLVIDLKQVQREISDATGMPIDEAADAYTAHELVESRTGPRLERLHEDMVEPLLREMHERGIGIDTLDRYLYARHAPERNARIAEINPARAVGGSGMTDERAAAIMAEFRRNGQTADLEALAARVDQILAFAVETRIDAGLLSQTQADAWRATYEKYVPLRGHAELDPELENERPRLGGSGVTVRGPESLRALGRESEAAEILVHAISQAQEAIIRAERNRVGQALYNLARDNPNRAFWTVDKVDMKAVWNSSSEQVEYRPVRALTAMEADHTVSLKIDGVEHRVTFNVKNPRARRLAEGMRRLKGQQFMAIVRWLGAVNRWLSAVNTSFAPEFIVTNAFRDVQTAAINLAQYDMDGIVSGTIKDYWSALAASMKGAFGSERGEWGRWYREFTDAGGRTYWNQVESIQQLRARLDSHMADLTGSSRNPAVLTRRFLHAVGHTVESVNMGVENAIRLAAYKNARERGMSQQQAASLAKNLTVNFNRRGAVGPLMNSFYLFYNASMQGTFVLLAAMKSRRVQKIAGGIIGFTAALTVYNILASDDDDDGERVYDKISDFDKQRNLIVMLPGTGGTYLKINMPYGYNVFASIGRTATEAAFGRDPMEAAADAAITALDAFNPIGGSDNLLKLLSPTIMDPIVELYSNRDFADRPIMPDKPQYGPEEPDAQRYWNNVSAWAKWTTDTLTDLTGGDKVRPGAIDISPEVLDYGLGVVAGAAGSFYGRAADSLLKMFDPTAEMTWNDVPFGRRVVGEKPSWYDKSVFYERANEIAQQEAYIKRYNEAGDKVSARKVAQENRDLLALSKDAKATRKELSRIRKERDALAKDRDSGRISREIYNRRMNALRDEEQRALTAFNRVYNKRVEE